jgi:hypothetical protein
VSGIASLTQTVSGDHKTLIQSMGRKITVTILNSMSGRRIN